MKILFSPVGITDPISSFRDGSMLHICRYYRPDQVYLYMSQEILGYHEKDNRYLYCLQELGKELGHSFDVRLIKRPELTDVHRFDSFIIEYRSLLRKIYNENPDAEMLLNVSSGTPAMKSALQILAALQEFPMQAIQVSTPVKASNEHLEDKKDYNPQEQWECNDDNRTDENRCTPSSSIHLLFQIQKEQLFRLIDNCDYPQARMLAEDLKPFLSEEFIALLDGASARVSFDFAAAKQAFTFYGYQAFPSVNKEYLGLTESLLWLQMKVKKKEYMDFLRGMTPSFCELSEMAAVQVSGVETEKYTEKSRDGVRRISPKRLENYPEIKSALNRFYEVDTKPVSSKHFCDIVQGLAPGSELAGLVQTLRDAEEKVRNFAAHDIIAVTAQSIKRRAGYTPEEYLDKLKKLARLVHLPMKTEDWKSYEEMNRILKAAAEEKECSGEN